MGNFGCYGSYGAQQKQTQLWDASVVGNATVVRSLLENGINPDFTILCIKSSAFLYLHLTIFLLVILL